LLLQAFYCHTHNIMPLIDLAMLVFLKHIAI